MTAPHRPGTVPSAPFVAWASIPRNVLSMIGGLGAAAAAGNGRLRPAAPADAGERDRCGVRVTGRPGRLTAADWGRLGTSLHGKLLRPDVRGYPDVARLYNPRFDGLAKPAAIAAAPTRPTCCRACGSPRTPAHRLRSRPAGTPTAAGPPRPGWSWTCPPSTPSPWTPPAGTARIGAGARLIDVYAALAAKNVALAAGSCPSVGFSGLTLGGGVGVLTRAWGLTSDAVRGFDIVTAEQSPAGRRAPRPRPVLGDPRRWRRVRRRHRLDRGRAARTDRQHVLLRLGRQPRRRRARRVAAVGPRTDPRMWSTCKILADPAKDRIRATSPPGSAPRRPWTPSCSRCCPRSGSRRAGRSRRTAISTRCCWRRAAPAGARRSAVPTPTPRRTRGVRGHLVGHDGRAADRRRRGRRGTHQSGDAGAVADPGWCLLRPARRRRQPGAEGRDRVRAPRGGGHGAVHRDMAGRRDTGRPVRHLRPRFPREMARGSATPHM